jgi:hypothetical protein
LAACALGFAIGCGSDGPDGGVATSGVTRGVDPSDSTTSSTAPVDDDGGLSGSSSSSTATTAADTTTTTGAPVQLCGIDDLAPGAMNPLVASDRVPMLLPTEIADILTRSCGCHLADDLVIPGDYPAAGTLDLTTWPAWHADFSGKPTYEAAELRLDPPVDAIVMPPFTCDVGGGETMRPEDRARLLEWIASDAPDGVQWSSM